MPGALQDIAQRIVDAIYADLNKQMVIVTRIWQKLSTIERKVTLIVRNFWQLFSRIFGETLLIVTHIWAELH
jgi:hypothetical protein